MIAVLAGGVGAAKFLRGLTNAGLQEEIVAIVNTGDDWVHYGLHISPDLDTIVYTLANLVNPETGWGLRDESFHARASLQRLGDDPWFTLGDRDIGLHMFRTQRLAEGVSLTQVTAEIVEQLNVDLTVLPMTNDEVATKVLVQLPSKENRGDQIVELDFQEYFVRYHHQPRVLRVRYDHINTAQPSSDVTHALDTARRIIIAPSNPILSIGPILALRGISEQLQRRASEGAVVAISPIIAGEAVKGPLAEILDSLMTQHDARTVAQLYQEVASVFIVDTADAHLVESIRATGLACLSTQTLMTDLDATVNLAQFAVRAR
ncbi:2-phospho-L-lactate transferase [Ferrimicrobium sp.]|uniref:2-phospho-L-lactate transferase n=1 Tax=Ferrimicrobium sp. TaxID=2926050 RepID=UPI002608D3C1|nr:2-phospho-L-lactate transferase [Ferrimicrobium sp.]